MTSPKSIPVRVENIPTQLKELRRWVVWKFAIKENGTGYAKIPYQTNGRRAKANDASTWCSYGDAFDAYLDGGFEGVGLMFDGQDGLVGIDLDDCIDGTGAYSDLAVSVLNRIKGYAEVSPSGTGLKLFTRAKLDRAFADTSKGIEIYPTGRYFTVTGHVIDPHADLPDGPQDLSWLIAEQFGQDASVADPGDALALYKPPLPDWDLDRVDSELLAFIDPASGYEPWIQAGQALYHQFDGSAEGLELWDRWSQQDLAGYQDGLCEIKWDSFSAQRLTGRGPVTLASLIKRANDMKQADQKRAEEEWHAKILECSDPYELRDELAKAVRKDLRLDMLGRESIAQRLKIRFKQLDHVLTIAMIRDLIRPRADEFSARNRPDWLLDWCYVTHEDKFFNVSDKRSVSTAGFNALYNRELNAGDDEPNAARMALDSWNLPVVTRVMYMPGWPDVFTLVGDSTIYANHYRPDSVPEIPLNFSTAQADAVEAVKAHISMIMGGKEENARILIEWMAFCVQNPGKKIRWAPLIKGIEGDGKTVLGKVMAGVMGMANVNYISPKVLGTDFNGWAERSCVAVLEEIRLVGHNRHDVLNALKPYITNDVVPIHRKGMDEYIAPNTVNYMAFTNYADALPIDDTDRRWWINFSPFSDPAQLAAATGQDYFDRLHQAVDTHYGALRKWLLEVEIRDTFKANGRAPESDAKRLMVSLSTTDEELDAKELLENGAPGVTKTVFSSPHFLMALAMAGDGEMPKTTQISRLCSKLGYAQLPWKVKWRGKAIRIWFKDVDLLAMDKECVNKYVRDCLDPTAPDEVLD